MFHPVSDPSYLPINPTRPSYLPGKRPTIGFLTACLPDPFATYTWSGVIDVARKRDANILNLVGARLRTSAALKSPAQVMFDLIDPAMLDGLIVFSEMLYHFVSMAEIKQFLTRYASVPMTSIGVIESIPSVMLDIELGMQKMIDHLVNVHGYRRLAYLSGLEGEQTSEALYRGYRKALKWHGISFDPVLVTPNQPGWGEQIGTEGVRVLLDARNLCPGLDFECIVGCGDREGLGVVEELQKRGLRVPDDVAVTGFNNVDRAHLASISLTTVDRKIGEVASRATEMLLDLLSGHTVPQNAILQPDLVVRRSCGCIPEMVRQAAPDFNLPISSTAQSKGMPFQWDKERIADQITSAGRPDIVGYITGLNPHWAEDLLNAFIAELEDDSLGQFLTILEGILRQTMIANRRVASWQGVLSEMRKSVRPYLWDTATIERAENLWQQARTLLGDFAERDQGNKRLNEAERVQIFNNITQVLMTTFDVDGIMDVLVRDLPQLGITSCYLSLYEDPAEPTGWARLVLAYDELGRIPIEPDGQRFPSRILFPPEFLRTDRRRDLVALPLHFHGEQLGFVIMEMGPHDGNMYEALRMQIGSALKGALLATLNEELYQEAVEARKAAEEADKMKSRFLSTVSHELRTPLSLIVGTIEMQLRDDTRSDTLLPEHYRHDLHNIRYSAQHLNRLISDVLDLASSQAGQLRLFRERVCMADLLAEVITLGEAMAREKGLAWHSDIPDDLPFVWGDRTRLQQVALNLISNAVKFTQSGTISLWAEVGKDQLVVAVSDTGMGIPNADQSIIFDEFYQSERTTLRGFSGIGLGLAISRHLVEFHGGQIGVLSSDTDGSGSTVYFSLPIMAWPGDEITPPVNRSGMVLVLTEQEADNNSVYNHLVSRGYEVEVIKVDSSTNWLAQIVHSLPGAVVLDYEPAVARGWDLMRTLRENLPNQDIPVVFYTLSEELDQGAVLELDYLIKPISTPVLARTLARQGIMPEECTDDCTILVVDDDPGILELHTRMLNKLAPRCHISKANDGREALEIMTKQRPDLVLLDLMMPVLDGFDVLRAMREQESTRNVPVIVLTAQFLTAQDMTRLQQGVAAVLTKGLFTSTEMLGQIEDVLSRNKHLTTETQQVVRQTMAYIHEHFAKLISRTELAARVGFSNRYLTQCFRQETGLTPIKYLNRYRIRQARILLERGEMNVTEVAQAVGFSDSSYFARVFREEVGISPRSYQQDNRPTSP